MNSWNARPNHTGPDQTVLPERFLRTEFTAPNALHLIHLNTQTSSSTKKPKFECLRKRSPALENNANLCITGTIRQDQQIAILPSLS